jgi:hypothetical protein
MTMLDTFREIWLADFEFRAPDGERPDPICLVAHEWHSGRTVRLFGDELQAGPPWSVGFDVLFIAYYASAELGCLLALGWELPRRILDLFAEFRNLTNGLPTVCGAGLLGALAFYGLDALDSADKDAMRQLAMRGGPFTERERSDLLDYCESDVRGLAALLSVMLPQVDLPRALLRGRYMAAAARIEWNGVPVDVETLNRLRSGWAPIKSKLIQEVDADYGVFVPVDAKVIDPATESGRTIIDAAARAGIKPERLAEAVDLVWRRERESTEAFYTAKREARRRTGLTPAKLNRFEDMYRDHSAYPGFDTEARTVAAAFPELGIGTGYRTEDGINPTDSASALWELLRDPQDRFRPRTDPTLIDEAVDLALNDPGDDFRPLRFSAVKFSEWLVRNDLPWPRLPTGVLDLSDDAFRQMARQYPIVAPLRELRFALSQLRLNELSVGSDGRNRCLLSAFRSTTGRNQPSNARFIFGPSCWLRALIQPTPGRALAYVDWEQQEFGIAAALSGDGAMREAYASGDPYLTFAKQAGAVPPDATKETHKAQRDQFKVCALAVQYGMGERSLAESIGKPEAYARELLRLHRQTYPRFWEWSQSAVDHAMLRGWLQTVFGWRVHVGPDANPRSLANFPMQANGAEMLRLACSMATEAGVTICAPVHDAVLIEADADLIDDEVDRMQGFMQQASEIILAGFPLRTDAKVITHPNRYLDARGVTMWEHVSLLLSELPVERETEAAWF